MCRNYDHIEKMTKDNRDEKLMKHLTDHSNENPIDHLDDRKYV